MSPITLYGFSGSTYLRTVQMVCEEKTISYTLKPLEFGAESHRALHPYLRMPVLQIGEVKLFETMAICSYLEQVFAPAILHPSSSLELALMYQWMSAGVDYIYPDLVHGMLDDGEVSGTQQDKISDQLNILEQALQKQDFLAGPFSAADLLVVPMLAFCDEKMGPGKIFTGLPALKKWYARMQSRPSFQKTKVS